MPFCTPDWMALICFSASLAAGNLHARNTLVRRADAELDDPLVVEIIKNQKFRMMAHHLYHQILGLFFVGGCGVVDGFPNRRILRNIHQIGLKLHKIAFHPVDRGINDHLHAIVLRMQYGFICRI